MGDPSCRVQCPANTRIPLVNCILYGIVYFGSISIRIPFIHRPIHWVLTVYVTVLKSIVASARCVMIWTEKLTYIASTVQYSLGCPRHQPGHHLCILFNRCIQDQTAYNLVSEHLPYSQHCVWGMQLPAPTWGFEHIMVRREYSASWNSQQIPAEFFVAKTQ